MGVGGTVLGSLAICLLIGLVNGILSFRLQGQAAPRPRDGDGCDGALSGACVACVVRCLERQDGGARVSMMYVFWVGGVLHANNVWKVLSIFTRIGCERNPN